MRALWNFFQCLSLTDMNTTKQAPNCQVASGIKILTLDALAGRRAPFEFLAFLDHLICDLLSLSKTQWIVYYIDFLPCGLLFKFSLAHCMALGSLVSEISNCSVTGEMIKGQWYSQLCQFSLRWLNFYRMSQFPYSLT